MELYNDIIPILPWLVIPDIEDGKYWIHDPFWVFSVTLTCSILDTG